MRVFLRCASQFVWRLKLLPRIKMKSAPTGHSPNGHISPEHSFSSSGVFSTSSQSQPQVANIREKIEEVLGAPEASLMVLENKTKSICQFYTTLIPQDKAVFLKVLSQDYGSDQATILQLASSLHLAQERGAAVLFRVEERLRQALVPRYQTLFTQISKLEQGVKFLVDMRTDVLGQLLSSGADHENHHLQAMNLCLQDLLRLWFSVGFFQLERITWESPCDMLQKISEYEAVHPIRNWPDLKRRVGPYRRCYVFTHNSMPREPVVILHTALTSDITSSIQNLVSTSRVADDSSEEGAEEDPNKITTAIFYSITSTQRGLSGVELGNYLIKNAVKELVTEFPWMQQFSSLSPIPGFKDWLFGEINRYLHKLKSGEDPPQLLLTEADLAAVRDVLPEVKKEPLLETFRNTLQATNWAFNEAQITAFEAPLMKLCARYLYIEKRRGFAFNPVANFHLRNGAVMWRLNWLGDRSLRGLTNSLGLMVNYRYFLEETEQNSKTYMENHSIAVSDQILSLVRHLPAASPSH